MGSRFGWVRQYCEGGVATIVGGRSLSAAAATCFIGIPDASPPLRDFNPSFAEMSRIGKDTKGERCRPLPAEIVDMQGVIHARCRAVTPRGRATRLGAASLQLLLFKCWKWPDATKKAICTELKEGRTDELLELRGRTANFLR